MMNDEVQVMDVVFSLEEKLIEEIREVIGQYNGRISYAQLLGILEMLKFEHMQEGYVGDD